jgi:hypothetical protein
VIHVEGSDVELNVPILSGHVSESEVRRIRSEGMDLAAEGGLHRGGIDDVIEMLVGDEEIRDDDIGAFRLDPISETLRGIDGNEAIGPCLDEIAITGNNATGEDSDAIHEAHDK